MSTDLSPVVQQNVIMFVIVQQTKCFPVQQKLFQLLSPLQLNQVVRILLLCMQHIIELDGNYHQIDICSLYF